ncbi:cadherin EGF LAG seven-pass G-type receptor 2-like [Mytilus edulis]|uniref:cadherin EGF LAG seven-pass G-type receptor 2-like n=1 Tax=Mytilus edulis TaxID=6550 RepID=UPI0039EE2751
MIIFLLVFLLCFCSGIKTINGQPCTGMDTVGRQNTQDRSNNDYNNKGVNAVLLNNNRYQFDCCGFISTWEIFARNGAAVSIDVKVQVWEDTGGNLWNLRGENTITATTADAENVVIITAPNRIRARKDDFIGFYEPFGSVVTYGGGGNYKTTNFVTDQTSYDWDSEDQGNNRDHAIHAIIVPSQIPVFTNLDDTVAVSNSEVAGTVLFTLTISDGDAEDDSTQLTLANTVNTGSASTLFEYDSLTLEIKVRAGVSLTPGDHSMTFRITDPCGQFSTGTLTLRVENDPPVITSLATSNNKTISEDLTTETLLHTLEVTEADPFTCQIDSTGVPFVIKTISGSSKYGIFLSAGASMDYDTQNAYVLDLSCTDTYDVTTGIYTVYLKRNNPPIINGLPLAIDVQEDSVVETTLYTMSVTDPENTAVTCSIPTITPPTTILFHKPSSNFNEFDIVLQSNPNLQYDLVRTFRLDISCTDGRRSDTGVFFVNVLRNKPTVFLNLQNTTTVSSISSYIGQIVFDVEVTDPENDQVQFSMSCVPSTNSPFEIYHSGEILLTRSIEGEFVPAYDCYVEVSDGKTTTGPRSLTVHVLDINYVPVIRNLPLPSPLVVSENSPLAMSVFQVSIQDNDGEDTHTYTMTSSPPDGILYFDIDSATGLVSTSATTIVDFEAVSSTDYTLTITVTDTKDSATQNLSLTVANVNEPPVYTKKSYVLSVNEGSAGIILPDPGYLYTDEDTGDTHKFSMTCGSNVGYFSISSTTGLITLATDIDVDEAGSAASYTCTVIVSDSVLTDSATLTINVNNINDNTPVFSNNLFTYYLDISYPLNTVFGSAVATDADAGTFGTFAYSIDQTSLGIETFGIQTNGDLYLKNSLTSYGYGASLSFTIQATDTGSLQGTATVFVVIPQTTTTSTTTTNRYITFWEYPANPAWVVILSVLGVFILCLPCFMVWKNKGSCTYKGRTDDYKERIREPSEVYDNKEDMTKQRKFNLRWKPWMWFERS